MLPIARLSSPRQGVNQTHHRRNSFQVLLTQGELGAPERQGQGIDSFVCHPHPQGRRERRARGPPVSPAPRRAAATSSPSPVLGWLGGGRLPPGSSRLRVYEIKQRASPWGKSSRSWGTPTQLHGLLEAQDRGTICSLFLSP